MYAQREKLRSLELLIQLFILKHSLDSRSYGVNEVVSSGN
jgi:hypothetical protein